MDTRTSKRSHLSSAPETQHRFFFFLFSSSHGHKDVQAIASFVGTRNATQIVSLNMMCVYIHRCTCVFYLHMCIESVLGTQNVLCACIYCVCVCVCVCIYIYIYILFDTMYGYCTHMLAFWNTATSAVM